MDVLAELDINPALCIATLLNAYKLADLDVLEPELRLINILGYATFKVPIYLQNIVGNGVYYNVENTFVRETYTVEFTNHTINSFTDDVKKITKVGWNNRPKEFIILKKNTGMYICTNTGPIYLCESILSEQYKFSYYINDPNNIRDTGTSNIYAIDHVRYYRFSYDVL